jgi:hypothetical protein
MKNFSATACSVIASLFSLIVWSSALAETGEIDHATAESNLFQQQERLYQLVERHGRYDMALLDALQRLIQSQMEASRFEAAAENVDYAIQIVRFNEGLETPTQYDLQELAVQVDLYRQDWPAIQERLEHYSQLVTASPEGNSEDLLQRLLWLSAIYKRGSIEDVEENHAYHLIRSTWYAETAVIFAQVENLDESRLYADMLYNLTDNYFLEARAILTGGGTSYRLRQLRPGLHQVEDKQEAVARRYRAGLSQLRQLRSLLSDSKQFDREALALAEFHIADWHALFDSDSDLDAVYGKAIALLEQADITAAKRRQFLSRAVNIPRARLTLSVQEALAASGFAQRHQASDSLLQRLSLIEPASHISGYSQDLEQVNWRGALERDWARISTIVTVDPHRKTTVRNGGIRTRSLITASDVRLQASEAGQTLTRKALRRLGTISFRPAFHEQRAISSELSVDYLVRGNSLPSLTPMVREPWELSFRGPVRATSLAAAGE